MNCGEQEGEGTSWASPLFIEDKEARQWQGLGLGTGDTGSQVTLATSDLQCRRERKGVWRVRQRLGGASPPSKQLLRQQPMGDKWQQNLGLESVLPVPGTPLPGDCALSDKRSGLGVSYVSLSPTMPQRSLVWETKFDKRNILIWETFC